MVATARRSDTPEAAAARIAEKARSHGVYLGRGNFGEAYAVGKALVKLPTSYDMHGRRRSLQEQRADFTHEVMVSRTLRARGHEVAPRQTLTALADGTPAIVREYGEIPANVTPQEYDVLGEALHDVVSDGWKVTDDLLVARRPNGTLFVADVGDWRPLRPGDRMDASGARDDVARLLRRFSAEQPWAVALPLDIYQQNHRGIATKRCLKERAKLRAKTDYNLVTVFGAKPRPGKIAEEEARVAGEHALRADVGLR